MEQPPGIIRRASIPEFIDPLYGICRIEEPFNQTLLNPSIQREIERLQGIKSLGLIFTFFPAANHTKWEHYLGMYSVAAQLKQQLKKKEQDQLQWLCLLGGFGHLPCTYITSSAIFAAISVSSNLKSQLKELIRPVEKMCKDCENKGTCASEPETGIFISHSYKTLRGSLSGYKLLNLPSDINIDHRQILVKGCICPQSKLYHIYSALSRYDYMQRDLYHSGLATFRISSHEVFRTLAEGMGAFEGAPSMKLLDGLYDYLVDSLYLHPGIACYEAMISKILASKLSKREISIEELINYNDQMLTQKLQQILGESPIAYVQKRPPVFVVKRDLSIDYFEATNGLKLEMELLKIVKKDLYEYPQDFGMILSVYPMEKPDGFGITFRTIINVLQDNERILPIVSTAFRMQAKVKYTADGGIKLAQEIFKYIFDASAIECDYSRIKSSFMSILDHLEIKNAYRMIKEVAAALIQHQKKEELPLEANRFLRILQHPVFRKKQPDKDTVKWAWERMIPCLIALTNNPMSFKKILISITNMAIEQAKTSNIGNPELIETIAFLAEISSIKYRQMAWVLPSVRINSGQSNGVGQRSDTKNEIDVLAIKLLTDRVQVKLLECTTSSSSKKTLEDYQKLEFYQAKLTSQNFKDLEIVTKVISDSHVNNDIIPFKELYSQCPS